MTEAETEVVKCAVYLVRATRQLFEDQDAEMRASQTTWETWAMASHGLHRARVEVTEASLDLARAVDTLARERADT